jgi:PAS domain S-box-containing protein
MAEERSQFSSTMRIDIPPDLLAGGDQQRLKSETTGIHKPRPTGKLKAKEKTPAKSLFSQLLQSIYDGCLITDLDGMIVDANARVIEFLKRDLDDVKGLRVAHLISGADENLVPSIRETLENDRFVLIQAYCTRSDGSIFPAEISVNSLDGEEKRLCFFIRDITVRKETEEMLRTGYNAIQNSANGIAVADLAGKLYYVNPAVVALWGYTRGEDLIGKQVADLWVDHVAAESMFKTILEQQDMWSGEMTARVAGGAEVPMQVIAARNRDADEDIVGVVFSFVDRRDQKRAEEAMRQAEGQRAMLASLAAACHHLGQPSTVIVANLALIERMMKNAPDEMKELLAATNQACEELAQILYRLNTIDVYKPQTYLENAQDKDAPENKILEI